MNNEIKNKELMIIGSTPIFLSLSLALSLLILVNFLPKRLPLLYSLPWGENQLVTISQFLIIPAIITVISLVNLVISWQLPHHYFFLKRILITISVVSCIILLISFLKIVLIFI